MRKKYEEPELDIIKFPADDVITNSGLTNGGVNGGGDTGSFDGMFGQP